mmetsp:Transcript_30065/g.59021  ORF Transcript_30065/g.59021 Transcript_30065/m.59021 type:complete len:116 (-) Transcript_30065:4778-5125(-)
MCVLKKGQRNACRKERTRSNLTLKERVEAVLDLFSSFPVRSSCVVLRCCAKEHFFSSPHSWGSLSSVLLLVCVCVRVSVCDRILSHGTAGGKWNINFAASIFCSFCPPQVTKQIS